MRLVITRSVFMMMELEYQWLSMPKSDCLKAVQWTKYKAIKMFHLKC